MESRPPRRSHRRREEAVDIMRKVIDAEMYFLPILTEALVQLAGYVTEKGDIDRTSTATAKSAEFQGKLASLPPQPDFLFEKVGIDGESDDAEDWETKSEDDECQDSSDTAINVEEMVSEAARAAISQFPGTSVLAEISDAPCTDAYSESTGIRTAQLYSVQQSSTRSPRTKQAIPQWTRLPRSQRQTRDLPRPSPQGTPHDILSTPLEMSMS
ncbi:hypothetical protein B0H19DRAFT_1247217 [Mycena capillaripes]|nr:hypothetical protein B0H19DRAFT_1247217 [Mycena capillaripes]